MDVARHVTHTDAALRILDDRKISRGLIYDECLLNDSRTTVVWLSPNQWVYGSRYGNVEFTFDFKGLVQNRKIYWVEVADYKPKACRFLITDDDVSHLPVTTYDPSREEGPLRYAEGLWYWNWTYTGEFMLESSLLLRHCTKVDFIKHHDLYCSLGGCNDQGKEGDRAAGRIIAYILARDIDVIDNPLIMIDPKRALSFAVDRGLSRILFALDASAGKLNGPLKLNASVDVALNAALLQYALGEVAAAKQTASLIGSDEIFKNRLSSLVEDHFGLRSDVLA